MSNTRKTTTKRAAQIESKKLPEKSTPAPIKFEYDGRTYVVDMGWMDRPTGEQAMILMDLDDPDQSSRAMLRYLAESGVNLRTIYMEKDWLDGFLDAMNEAIAEQDEVGLGEDSGSDE